MSLATSRAAGPTASPLPTELLELRDRVRSLHQPFDHILQELLHKASTAYAAAALAFRAFFKKLATVSLGCAPLLSQ